MKIQLTINGETINAEISEEDAAKFIKPRNKSGWGRVKEGEDYYIINDVCGVDKCTQTKPYCNGFNIPGIHYNVANYFNDKEFARKIADKLNLYRRMLRWADEHNEKPIDWSDVHKAKYFICYDNAHHNVAEDFNVGTTRIPNVVYFRTKEIAQQAINEFGDEIIKTFSEDI